MLVITCWSWQAPTPKKWDLRALIKILPSKNTFFFFFESYTAHEICDYDLFFKFWWVTTYLFLV